MTILWILLSGLPFYAPENHQEVSDPKIAELCRFHVIYFEIGTNIRYYKDYMERNPADRKTLLLDETDESDRIRIFDDVIAKFETLSTKGLDHLGQYGVEQSGEKFLKLDVCHVYSPTFPAHPYKLGSIKVRGSDGILFVRFSGFSERIHFEDDSSEFRSYNDDLDFTVIEHLDGSGFTLFWYIEIVYTMNDFSLDDRSRIDDFVADWIQLTRYSGRPGDFKLISNEFDLIDGALVGNCRTAEPDRSSTENSSVAVKEWSYKISGFQLFNREKPSLELVSQTTSEDTSGILSP